MFWLLLTAFVLLSVLWCLKHVYLGHKDCHLTRRLDGRLAIVTGSTGGVGLETAGELARRGACVVMACRDASACEKAREDLLARYGGQTGGRSGARQWHLSPITGDQLICEHLDLTSPDSIRAFAARIREQHPRVDILVNNAGVSFPTAVVDPVDGIEENMRVNHLGHFLLTNLLLPCLLQQQQQQEEEEVTCTCSPPVVGRVVNVASLMHRYAELNPDSLSHPHPFGLPYANSKLANVMHARHLANTLYHSQGLLAVSLHPGFVRTGIFRHQSSVTQWAVHNLLTWLAKTPLQGAQTVVFCCLADNLKPGGYYDNCRLARVNPQATDDLACQKVWDTSERLVRHWEEKRKESRVE